MTLICRFNGLCPQLVDLHRWITEVWKHFIPGEISILLFARGFFVVDFESPEERKVIQYFGPWFWEILGLFFKPWNLSFDLVSDKISSSLVLVRHPNIHLHLWNLSSLEAIGNSLSTFLYLNPKKKDYFKTTFA